MELRDELSSLLNKYSLENGSNTPDFILANYLLGCLENFNKIIGQRELWYGRASKDKKYEIQSKDQHSGSNPGSIQSN